MTIKPWDAQLANQLIRPLKDSWVNPNYFTTLRLLAGLGAAAAFASGEWPNLGAFLLVLSNFLDHTDGELARLSDKVSKTGHFYDLASDAVVHVFLFISIGIGLRDTPLGTWALPLGIVAGLAVAAIFHMRNEIEKYLGKEATRQPSLGGFEAEDVLYLIPVVTLLDGLLWFLVAAAIGAPIAIIFVARQFFRLRHAWRT